MAEGGGEWEEEEGRKEGRREALRIPSRWKPRLPKPLQLAGASPPLRKFSSHREYPGFLGGTPVFRGAMVRLGLPNLLL